MSLLTKKTPSFQGVAAGQTATCNLALGLTYHVLALTYSGITLAEMNEIRLVANGKVIQRWASGTQLDLINQFEGRAASTNGVLMIPVGDRYGMKSRDGVEFSGLGTGALDDPNPIVSLYLEIDIDAAALAPALSMIALQSDASNSGLIKRVEQYSYAPAGAGDFDISDLPKGNIFGQLYFASANINSIEIRRNGYTVFDRTAAENNAIQADGVRIPQAGYFVVDLNEQGYGSEGLVTKGVQDLRIVLNMSAAGVVPLTLVSIGPVTG